MTRSPIRRVSKKRAKRGYAKWAAAYLELHPYCAVFPVFTSEEIHHMAGGRDKNKTLTEEAAVLAVSRQGHEFIQNRPKAQQLAYKLCATPEEFDLQKFNALRGVKGDPNPPQETTLADVASWLTPVAF